jgi:hypothetical protein
MTTEHLPPAFVEHFDTEPPDVLYHYTGQAGLLGIVGKAELWCTKVQYMNDAKEFGLALDMARNKLDVMIATSGGIDPHFASPHSVNWQGNQACIDLRHSLDGLEQINLFAACFCKDGDLLSQWRGYAGGTQGYSIGFDANALRQCASTVDFTLGRCIYDVDLQQRIVEQAITHCLENELAVPPRSQWGGHGPLADILFRCGVFFKEASFAEEKEWRLISPTIMFHDEWLSFRSGRSMIMPHYRLQIRRDGDLPIQHVIVGPCPHMELSKSAVTALLLKYGVKGPHEGREIAFKSIIPFRDW